MTEDSFTDGNYAFTKLYVPEAALEAYKNHEIWGKFSTMIPLSLQENLSASRLRYWISADELCIDGVEIGKELSLYTIDGLRIHTQIANDSELRIKLDRAGSYILSVGKESFKIFTVR